MTLAMLGALLNVVNARVVLCVLSFTLWLVLGGLRKTEIICESHRSPANALNLGCA